MNFKEAFKALIRDAHYYQYAGINSSELSIKKNKPRCYLTKIQWYILMISVVTAITTVGGFSREFAGYVVSALSLFVGLFFSFILMLIDKFQKTDFSPYKMKVNAQLMPIGVRLKNYYKGNYSFILYYSVSFTMYFASFCIIA